jgi:SAM-dependent methyltransferase
VDNFLAQLTEQQLVVDLGSGRGSFHYELYKCKIIAIDVTAAPRDTRPERAHARFLQGDSAAIPLSTGCADAVICHHTLEHFPEFRQTLIEVNRILKDQGLLWIAVPDGYGLDDQLYRFLFSGGGHVNRFSRDSLIKEVHALTRFRLIQEVDLFTSFIYLKQPTPEEYQYFPRRVRMFLRLPGPLRTASILTINAFTRVADRLFSLRISHYGWGFVFGDPSRSVPPLPVALFNVCSKCGSGISTSQIRRQGLLKECGGLGLYHCPNCKQLNSFVAPPPGLE